MLRLLSSVIVFFWMCTGLMANESLSLEWEDLVPKTGKGTALSIQEETPLIGAPDRKSFQGDDEEYAYLLESYSYLRYAQPQGAKIRTELNGKVVRIPGYITPLSFSGEKLTEFLLVPYLGACIHVPPPPGNQIVYVKNVEGLSMDDLYNPIWVTGTISAKPVGTVLADVGYQIDGPQIEPYQWQ